MRSGRSSPRSSRNRRACHVARILVTGASGLLGANLVLTAAGEHEVVAVSHQHPIRLKEVMVLHADLSQPGEAQRVIRESGSEWVIHCAAATELDACEVDPVWAQRLNRDMAGSIAEAAKSEGVGLVHISTDAVFDGERDGCTEADPPRPISVYGKSKLAGEQAVAEAYPEALIVRTNFYGWNALPKHSLAEWFLDELESGRGCGGFVDVWFKPILVNDLARLLLGMVARGLRGTFHVLGGECLSKYQFGVRLAEAFGLDPKLISPIEVAQLGLKAPRSKRLCLDTTKVTTALGLRLPRVDEGLRRFAALRQDGFHDRLKAMAGVGTRP